MTEQKIYIVIEQDYEWVENLKAFLSEFAANTYKDKLTKKHNSINNINCNFYEARKNKECNCFVLDEIVVVTND